MNMKVGIADDIAAMRQKQNDDELRESMRRYGWVVQFPALQDEHGVTLVGNRRLRIAKALGIEPCIKVLTLGKGEVADAERLKLALVSNIGGAPLTTEERKQFAIHLFEERNWTQARIGEALGAGRSTIGRYLEGILPTVGKIPRDEKRGRPKAPPKDKSHRNPSLNPTTERAIAKAVLDEGKGFKQAAAGVGSEHVAKIAVAKEQGRREERANPTIDQSSLPMSSQQKLEAAIRQAKRVLDAEYEQRFQARLVKHFEGYLIPHYRELELEAERVIKSRKGVMSLKDYNSILKCLHPDKLGLNADPQMVALHNDALQLFKDKKLVLVAEKENPTRTDYKPLPRTYAELMAAKEAAKAARRDKRERVKLA